MLEENNKEKAKAHFSEWQKCLDANKVESIPEVFEKVLAGIKKNPDRVKNTKKVAKPVRNGDKITS